MAYQKKRAPSRRRTSNVRSRSRTGYARRKTTSRARRSSPQVVKIVIQHASGPIAANASMLGKKPEADPRRPKFS